MRRRAEQVDETRQRITEAAVRLHTTVGPAHTSIAGVAEEAGVTRLTVYRHFQDQDALFAACMGHWIATHPGPDVGRWTTIQPAAERAAVAFSELYAWYAAVGDELSPIHRDRSAMPATAQEGMRQQTEAMAAAILGDDTGDGSAGRGRRALAGHLVAFETWQSLVRGGGLTPDEAAWLAASVLESTRE